jgi:hypothetical protein
VSSGSRRLPLGGCLLLALVLAGVLTASAGSAAASARESTPYAGLGTWIDIYAGKAAWRHPGSEIAAMARHGVRTLYLETGNYRQSVDFMRPRAQGRFIDDAHAAGIRVIAWYLPSFANLNRDERRALAAINFRSPRGEQFDGFALDIEATVVRGIPLRDQRLLQLSARLRAAVGADYPLGAITPSPIGMSPSYWPGIPYRALAGTYDAFLPMAYSTDADIHGRTATLAYLAATVKAIRTRAGNPQLPIHLIGGLTWEMGSSETAGFIDAVADCDPLGYSLYAFPSTHRAAWRALDSRPKTRAGACT